ncbi:ExeM/NucH family extracellular endonuclease [Aliagarivorans taiwanensis]|uniref:ExeM/NucH family extracellular endonuclease n=1 Tax=Aliagarivorans taiwanensis TaxID=561966 RepID=UPI0003FB4728|nr:ExeM/NucH family extracellular endonuclease [Aliagarivorans taiwanensis]
MVLVNNQGVIGNHDNAVIPAGIGSASSVVNFNGDDAVGLFFNGVLVDRIGQIGVRQVWTGGGGSTKDMTLRRITGSDADNNNESEFNLAARWFNFAQNTVDGLGCIGVDACSNDGSGGDGSGDGGGEPTDPELVLGLCGEDSTPIHALRGQQGGSLSNAQAMLGQRVVVEAVVVGDFQGVGDNYQLSGFFLQHADANQDSDDATSEGVFVYHFRDAVNLGERVRVLATFDSYSGGYQLTSVEGLSVCGEEPLPSATPITLPLADTDLGHLEGMRVSLPQTLHATPRYNFNRYGETVLSLGKRYKSTQLYPAGTPEAFAVAEANILNRLLLDDGVSAQNPPEISYFPQLSAELSLRAGSEVSGVEGVLNYAFSAYRVQSTSQPNFIDANPRSAEPQLVYEGNGQGTLKVASFNVLNFFTDLDLGEDLYRGANTAEEFERQRAKLVAALVAMDADIVGLVEIQNNGFSDDSAIANLVDAVNAELSEQQHYAFVAPAAGLVGNDAIAVGLIYRPAVVATAGEAELLEAYPFDAATAKHRVPLIQRFEVLASGEQLSVAVNHFKSKGSCCDALGDPDMNDGQGNCNGQRVLAAQTLSGYFDEQTQVLLMGDFNAYAKEDPMLTFEAAGFTNVVPLFEQGSYSYYFDEEAGSLDHALADSALLSRVVAATDWHINADEPRGLDYNTEYKTEQQIVDYYAPSAYRASDHDPVVLALDMRSAGRIEVAPSLTIVEGETAELVFQRSGGSFGEVVISYQIVADSADESDLPLLSGELVWGDGDQSPYTLNIGAYSDSLIEEQERAELELRVVSGSAKLAEQEVDLLIEDSTPLAVNFPATEFVFDEGARRIQIPVELNGPANERTRVWALILPGSASWRDYRAAPIQLLSWREGESGSRYLNARIRDDRRVESEESFHVYLLWSRGAELGAQSYAEVIISDND